MPVFFIAVGGPTCSGKTTLAKYLRSILPNASILHLDDFAPPSELVPIHPIHNVQDWDDPEGAIEWNRYLHALQHIKSTSKFPQQHKSHDHLNEQTLVHVPDKLLSQWQDFFASKSSSLSDYTFVLIDGFLLYAAPHVTQLYDIRFFVNNDYQTLKERRHNRHGYHTAVQSDPEGELWRDPPGYWDNIVWPAYIKANKHLFKDQNVDIPILSDSPLSLNEFPIQAQQAKETPSLSSYSFRPNKDIVLLQGSQLDMSEILDKACSSIAKSLNL